MKFGYLIEYNMENIFLKKSSANIIEELFQDPLLKNQNWAYLWINSLKFGFIACQVDEYQKILKLSCRTLTFTSYKAISKNEKRSGTSLSASIFAWVLKKNISLVIFYHSL